MRFILIRVHMTQGCVSVGMIPISLSSRKTPLKLGFLLSHDTLQVLPGKTKKYEMGGVHFKKQNGRQRGIVLFHTPATQWRKEYNGNITSNHTEK
jgi:hypothetical protein